MASTGIHHSRMANTKDINTIQYAENKTQSEMEYINSKITNARIFTSDGLPGNCHGQGSLCHQCLVGFHVCI